MDPSRPLWLRCVAQNYDWGRAGESSAVARLLALNSAAEIDPANPYAEFWVGTHPSGPSVVVSSEDPDSKGVTLKSWILGNPGAVGEKVVEKWGRDLPFLFKVLSVAKALSIQAHPDKELAKVLHKIKPDVYKDANHKPEMAIALTDFEALCGFVGVEELKDVLLNVPEIRELIGCDDADSVMNIEEQDTIEEVKTILKSIYTRLMATSKEAVSDLVAKLKSRLVTEMKIRMLTAKEQLVLLLDKQYPADVGVISAFFLNYVKLKPGEALYIAANEPHAYLSGECIECMATSDNVVRAGLTPKYKDVPTLCSMLTYKQGFPKILQGTPLNRCLWRYTPPFDEFEVDRIILPSLESLVYPPIPGPSIFLVLAGAGNIQMGSRTGGGKITEGDVLFVPANNETRVTAGAAGTLQMYRAGVNSMFFK